MALTQISTKGIKDGTITGSDLATSFATTGDFTFTGETSGYNAVWDKSDNALEFADNAKIKIGGGGDGYELYHDGSASYIKESGTGNLRILASNLRLADTNNNQYAFFYAGGAAELNYAGNKKFETTNTGVKITGSNSTGTEALGDFRFENAAGTQMVIFEAEQSKMRYLDDIKATFGTGDDLQLYHNGSDSYIDNDTGRLLINTASGEVQINKATSEYMARFIADGAVELYNNNSKKFETTSIGVTITGNTNTTGAFVSTQTGGGVLSDNLSLVDNKKVKLGDSDDLQLYHTGSHSYIKDAGTGNLIVSSSQMQIINAAEDEMMARFDQDGAVELYFDGTKRFETRSDGVTLTGQMVQTSTSARAIALNRLGSAGQMILFDFQGTKCGEILVDTNSTSYITNGSDKSLKKNFQSWSENVLNLFKNINPQEFHFNNQQDTDKKHKGYIAQDMVDSFPEAYPKDDEGKYAFNPSGMVVYLMKAIQELEAEVAALKAS